MNHRFLSFMSYFVFFAFLTIKSVEATSCFGKPKRVFVGFDASNSISTSDIVKYKPFLERMIDDLLLDTNTDNEMLVYYYSKASYSGYIDSNVWTSGDSNHVQQYKNIVNNHNFFQDSATISQQAWRAADLAFESKFSEPSGEYEEIVVIVGDGMPRRQYNMNLDTDNTWVWTNHNLDSDMKLPKQKGYVTRNGVKLYEMDFTQQNCDNFYGTLSASSTGLSLPPGICGAATWGSTCGNKCKKYKINGKKFEIFVKNDDCTQRFSNAPNTCKDYCHQDCLIEAFEATYFRYKYAGSSTRSRRVVTVGVGIKDDDGNDDVNVKTFLGKIGDTYVDIADFTTLSTDDSVEDATCGQVCSPLPNPLPNYVLGVDSRNGCDAGLKMNYDTRCDVQCDTSLGYEAGTGYYECPENGGDPILNINCQQASCEVNQRVLNGACVACPPGTTNAAGDNPSGPNTQCDVTYCDVNEHVVSNQCVTCPPGTTNAAGDSAANPDSTCDTKTCDTNEHVSNNACVPCPPGTTNDAGDDASGPNTDCDTMNCAVNEQVSNNACVPCPPGTTNDAGDPMEGPDTTCDVTLCDTNQRVLNNTCVACDAGTTNDAGDDASGPDTTCDVTTCSTNQRVSNNTCVACAAGFENDAGDDASGPDTSCTAIPTTTLSPTTTTLSPTTTTLSPTTTTVSDDSEDNSGSGSSGDGELLWIPLLALGILLCCCLFFFLVIALCRRRKDKPVAAPLTKQLSIRGQGTIQV